MNKGMQGRLCEFIFTANLPSETVSKPGYSSESPGELNRNFWDSP